MKKRRIEQCFKNIWKQNNKGKEVNLVTIKKIQIS